MFKLSGAPGGNPWRTPHVDVVVPCYNYGRFLPEAVASIKSQPGVTTRVHIIDDASTDGSAEVAWQLAQQHPGVMVTVHEKNRGHIATYNEGLRQADSDYVVLLSADDMLAPGALQRAARIMDARPGVGLVYGHPQTFEHRPTVQRDAGSRTQVWTGRQWIGAQFRRNLSIIYSPEAVVRTSIQHQVGYYREDLPHSGDLEMWLRIASVADVGRVAGPDQAFRRVHSESMMNKGRFSGVSVDLSERHKAYEAFLASYGRGHPDRKKLENVLRRKISEEALHWATLNFRDRRPEAVKEVRQILGFVESINPQYEGLGAWKEYARTSGASPTVSAVSAIRGRLQRELGDKIRWHRWERFGY